MEILTKRISPPLPTPCIALAVINIPIVIAEPANALPTKKIAAATSKIGLRPQISEIFPHEGTDAALPSRSAEPIHVYPALEPKCCAIVGRAVVTIVMSSAARNTLAQREAMMMTV